MDGIHYARLESSERLQRFMWLLRDYGWHGTREIQIQANVCNVSAAASELRAQGIGIETVCRGVGRFEYRLET